MGRLRLIGVIIVKIKLILGASILLLVSMQVNANLITFKYEGAIENIIDVNAVLDDSIFIGQTFSGSYTFETTTSDTDTNNSVGLIYLITIKKEFTNNN